MSYLSQFNHQITGSEHSPKKLVFLHGLMGYGSNWRSIAKAFIGEYHILTYDQRGHGRSYRPSAGFAPEDFAQDLLFILDELGWQKVHLVGHSMGGRAAAYFTYAHPSRVQQLVIEDMGPEAHPEAIGKVEELLLRTPVPFVSRQQARDFFTGDFRRLFHGRPQVELLGQFLYSNLQESKTGGMDWRFEREAMLECVRAGRHRDRWLEFKNIKVPALLVRGENSLELPRDEYERVLAECANFQGVEVPGAGHWVHYDQPELFSRELHKFFANSPFDAAAG